MMDLFGATAALGLYRMTPGTPLMAELEAMSQGLESLGNRLEELEIAMDPERMNLTQLRLWADTMEIPRWAGLEEGELRRWVKAFWKGGGFTLEALRQALLDGEIFLELQEEDGQLFLRGVERHPLDDLRRMVELLRRRAPAQAQLNVDVSSPTWEQLDQMDLTAAQWEGIRLDWEAFDFTGGLEWTAGQEG